MAKMVARLPATAAFWIRIQTSLKNIYKLGDINKEVANLLYSRQTSDKDIHKKELARRQTA
jgi:hypothetical protein